MKQEVVGNFILVLKSSGLNYLHYTVLSLLKPCPKRLSFLVLITSLICVSFNLLAITPGGLIQSEPIATLPFGFQSMEGFKAYSTLAEKWNFLCFFKGQ